MTVLSEPSPTPINLSSPLCITDEAFVNWDNRDATSIQAILDSTSKVCSFFSNLCPSVACRSLKLIAVRRLL